MRALMLCSCLLLALAACSRPAGTKKPVPAAAPEGSAPAPEASAAEPAAGAHVVAGTVPPASNGVSTIVVLEPNPPRQLPASDPATMDQVNRVFTPDILFARVGDPVEFRNSDDELHNVNVTNDATKAQVFNVAIIPQTIYKYTFAREGLYDVHCDIHQTMAALIVASASPYAKLADPDGRIQFDDVAPGGYLATAYVGDSRLQQAIDVAGPRTEIALHD